MERYKKRYGVSGIFGNRVVAPFVAYLPLFQKREESYGSEYWATHIHMHHYQFLVVGGSCG